MREMYHINRLLTMAEYKTRSGDWEFRDSLANADPTTAAHITAAEDPLWFHDEATAEMREEPSYWADLSREMDACQDNHKLARLLGFMSCRFAFMHAAVQCSLAMVEFTLQEMEAMTGYAAPAYRRRLMKGTVMNSEGLRYRIEFLASNVRHMSTFAAIEARMQTMQTVVSFRSVSYTYNE